MEVFYIGQRFIKLNLRNGSYSVCLSGLNVGVFSLLGGAGSTDHHSKLIYVVCSHTKATAPAYTGTLSGNEHFYLAEA